MKERTPEPRLDRSGELERLPEFGSRHEERHLRPRPTELTHEMRVGSGCHRQTSTTSGFRRAPIPTWKKRA